MYNLIFVNPPKEASIILSNLCTNYYHCIDSFQIFSAPEMKAVFLPST
jgi:hypothetical protein